MRKALHTMPLSEKGNWSMAVYKTEQIGGAILYLGDCLELMRDMPDGSIDAIITDPPYGTTTCKWDSVIPFEPMWEQLKRIIKPNGAIVLFGSQPFTSLLIASNTEMFKYHWVWDKCKVGGFTSAKLKPLKIFEDICVFSFGKTANLNKNNMVYYPQGLVEMNKVSSSSNDKSATGYARPSTTGQYLQTHTNYPKQLIKFSLDKKRIHPTQKPVALLEYLIKTYTNENETVLDFTFGSGTTGVACKLTGRRFIGIEKDPDYFDIACSRIARELRERE
jgi:site-specific DNA-methyltransferase (adenine-specific)